MIKLEAPFGDEDPTSPRKIKEYIKQVKLVSKAASDALTDDAPLIKDVIAHSPGIPILMGFDLRRKAARVEEPLMEAANAMNAAKNLANLAWQRFYHDFREVLEAPAARKRSGREMDWTDV
ncbi:MAG TPA: hypothetical protein VFX60_19240 [Micromonospora sp.]|nr:hypothetical protein [Micromonospora sp.]